MRTAASLLICVLLGFVGKGASGEDFECLIRPKSTISVGVPAAGVIAQVHVDRGDRIEKGELLIELESRVEEARLEIARARAEGKADLARNEIRVRFAEGFLERQIELSRESVITASDMDEAISSKDLASAGLLESNEARHLAMLDVDRAEAELERRMARSPLTGVVVERLMSPGEYVDAEPVLELAQLDPLHVEVFAPISMIDRVRIGSTARVRPEAPVGGDHLATVSVVDAVVDAASGTFRIRLEIPNPDYAVMAGLRCTVEFDAGLARVRATLD